MAQVTRCRHLSLPSPLCLLRGVSLWRLLLLHLHGLFPCPTLHAGAPVGSATQLPASAAFPPWARQRLGGHWLLQVAWEVGHTVAF